jgi:hypothetical protein
MAARQFKVGQVVILHSTRHGVWAEPSRSSDCCLTGTLIRGITSGQPEMVTNASCLRASSEKAEYGSVLSHR